MVGKTFKSDQNRGLQAAYARWASSLVPDQIVAIDINDSIHAVFAMLGVLSAGRSCGITTMQSLGALQSDFTPLTTQLEPIEVCSIAPNDASFITFTSGSTGTPKAIVRSQESWIYSFDKLGTTQEDKVGIFGALTFSLSLYGAMEAINCGAEFVDLSKFSPVKKLNAISKHTLSILFATPSQLRLLPTTIICPQVTRIMIGGGPFEPTDRAHIRNIFPNAAICGFYGLAETSFVTISDDTTPIRSVGKAFDVVNIKIENGIVLVKSPMLAEKYHTGDLALDNGFFNTGEIGRIDAEGNLFLIGRSDRAVTVADKTVHLDMLECELRNIKGVLEAGVISLPDEKRGNRPYGAIMGNCPTPIMNGLGRVIQLEQWPHLDSGKTDYISLKEIIKDRLNAK